MRSRALLTAALAGTVIACLAAGCNRGKNDASTRASGYVEATEVRVAGEVGGRLIDVLVEEGKRVNTGDVIARLDTSDIEIALRRAHAEKD